MTIITLATHYEIEDCIHCGFQFGLPVEFVDRRRQDHASFFCPACRKNMHYPAKSRIEKVEEKLRRKTECCDFYTTRTVDLQDDVAHQKARVRGYQSLAARRQRELQTAKGEGDA